MDVTKLKIVAVQYTANEIQVEFSNGEKWKGGPMALLSGFKVASLVSGIVGYWARKLSDGESLRFGSGGNDGE